MRQSAFQNYKLNQASRKQLDIHAFGGVDYSTQKFLIADGHAIDLKNFLYRNGVVQKRHGAEHLFSVKDFSYIPSDFNNPTSPLVEEVHTNEDKTFNGLWKFEAEDGQMHVIAHIGKLLYEIVELGTDYVEARPIVNGTASVGAEVRQLAFEYESFKSFAFVGGKKLWFLGGNKYMCIRYLLNSELEIFTVENSEHTPVPTTTISITYTNAVASKRESLDNVNLLTMWRKNKLISGVTKIEDEKTQTKFFEYTLDAPLIVRDRSDTAGIAVTIEEQGEIDYGV